MVMDLFESLLDELSKALNIPDLHPDQNKACLIKFKTNLRVQVEMDSGQENVLIASTLGTLQDGRYKENILREALKANGLPGPLHGILAYSTKTGHLILFEYLPTKELTGDKIADAIAPFSEKALRWKNAIENNEVPSIAVFRSSGGMFGLRP